MTASADTAKPLRGRVVVVTRAREQAPGFRGLLEAAGAEVLTLPTIAIEAPASWEPLDRALAELGRYQWIVFTSVNGVEMVSQRLARAGLDGRALAKARVAAVGPATAEAVTATGVTPEVVPDEYVAEALVARLRPLIRPGDRVLLPRAARSRDVLVRELTGMGAVVDEIAAYRTRAAAEDGTALREALRGGRVDVITFTSSSTVSHFAALLSPDEIGRLMAGVTVACIGPVTRATAAEHGLTTHIMPRDYTIPALAEAVASHFAEKGP
jgi:uroporphyrinogen III methyltransferase/synthase